MADLRPALAVAAADGVMRSTTKGWCVAVQATMNIHAWLVFNTLMDRKPMAIKQQRSHVIVSQCVGNQAHGCVED